MERILPRTSPVRRQKKTSDQTGRTLRGHRERRRTCAFKGGVEGFAGSGPTSDMEFQGGVLKGTPERSGFGSVGSRFRLVTNKLRGLSRPLTAGMTGEFLAEVIAELFPRVEPFAFPPVDFPRDEIRDAAVTERKFAYSSKRPRRGPRLRARTTCITAYSASPPGCCVRVSRRSTPRASEKRHFRLHGKRRT